MAFKYSTQASSPISRGKSKSPLDNVHQMNAINNNVLRASPRRQANQFAEWYKKIIDSDRSNFGLYMADDAILQWFGKTIKTKKKISEFIRYEMSCTSHRFTCVEATGPITVRGETIKKKLNFDDDDDGFEELATPLDSDSPICIKPTKNRRRERVTSSPEWETTPEKKKEKSNISRSPVINIESYKRLKRKRITPTSTTPAGGGQGDSLGASSSAKRRALDQSIDYLAELPRFYVEARCILEFMRTRNKRGAEIMKWERECKVQVSYSEDPMFAGEYIIWALVYSDNNKCRRNLLAAFNAVSDE